MYKKRIYRHTHKKPIILKNYVYMNAKINKAYCVPYRRQQFSRSERKVIVILTMGFYYHYFNALTITMPNITNVTTDIIRVKPFNILTIIKHILFKVTHRHQYHK